MSFFGFDPYATGRAQAPDPARAAEILAGLNPEQTAAVLHGDGPLLLLAGAGSGKTRAIAHRVAHLVACRGVAPSGICALTFTNRAALELRERVQVLVGAPARWIQTGTFHAFAARTLRGLAPVAGRSPHFSIYDEDDQLRLLKQLCEDLGLHAARKHLAALRFWLGLAKSRGGPARPEDLPEELRDEDLAALPPAYDEALRQADAFDFGDLILRLAELLEDHPQRREVMQARLRHLLVDEYQDTSPAQDRLLAQLAGPHGNLVVVGDDDQAIYGWRGASARNILDFPARYPGCAVLKLERNYRSRPPILAAAQEIIARSAERTDKVLRPERAGGVPVEVRCFDSDHEEAEGVVALAQEHVAAGGSLAEVAVFVRAAWLSRRLETALLRARVPYTVVGSVSFHGRQEIKDLLAHARLLVNPHDAVAAERALQRPRLGVGPKTLQRLRKEATACGGDWILALERVGQGRGAKARGLAEFAARCTYLRARILPMPPSVALQVLLEESGLRAWMESLADPDLEERLANLKDLIQMAAELEIAQPDASLAEYLEQSSLVSGPDAAPRDAVSILTLHGSKGLEFPLVVMLGLEEGLLPLTREESDAEEERRLCYVGMTRARERLVMTHCRARWRFTEIEHSSPSRFLDELPPTVSFLQGGLGQDPALPRRAARPPRRGLAPKPAPAAEDPVAVAPFPDYEGPDPSLVWDELAAGPAFPPGCRVLHELFGEGEVVEVSGHGPMARFAVRFPIRGVKRVLGRHLKPC